MAAFSRPLSPQPAAEPQVTSCEESSSGYHDDHRMRLLLALDCQPAERCIVSDPLRMPYAPTGDRKSRGGRGSSVTRNVCFAATSEGIPRPTNDHSPAGLLWVIQDIPTLNDARVNEFGNRMPLGEPIG